MDNQDQAGSSPVSRPRIGFYIHVAVFLLVNALLITINLRTTPENIWFYWPLMGWGLGIVLHAGLLLALPNRPASGQRRLAAELRSKPRTSRRSRTR